jgi:hypothetical protein
VLDNLQNKNQLLFRIECVCFTNMKKVFVVDFKQTNSSFQLSTRINSKRKILIYYVASKENKGFKFIFVAQRNTQFESYQMEIYFW